MSASQPVPVIVGPTAGGKTDLALRLARELDGEIISADSRQVYRYLTIGTAKPVGRYVSGQYLVDEIPYHLIDFLAPDVRFSAAGFVQMAEQRIRDVESRGKRAILAGGTGLYLKALFEGLAPLPPADESLREELKGLAHRQGRAALHAELTRVDPAAAAAIPSNNIQRVIRALEVFRLSGKPISAWHREHRRSAAAGRPGRWKVIGLDPGKEALDRRIEDRCRRMADGGMIEETAACLRLGFAEDCPGLSGLGYPRVVAYLKGGLSKKEMLRLLIQDTRQYAKRQRTWFRHQMTGVQWNPPAGRVLSAP